MVEIQQRRRSLFSPGGDRLLYLQIAYSVNPVHGAMPVGANRNGADDALFIRAASIGYRRHCVKDKEKLCQGQRKVACLHALQATADAFETHALKGGRFYTVRNKRCLNGRAIKSIPYRTRKGKTAVSFLS